MLTHVGFGGAEGLALQADGKIVVAGTADSEFALARYTFDGTLDPTFGNAGIVRTAVGPFADGSAIAIQTDGRIVVAGSAFLGGADVFVLTRYGSNGVLDGSFGRRGRVFTSFGDAAGANAVVIQTDGKIVAAGASASQFALARYGVTGGLDPTFGAAGKVLTPSPPETATALALAIQPDGRIVAAGDAGPSIGLARYTADGSLDATFGAGGQVTTDLPGFLNVGASSVALQSDGRIVTAGAAFSGVREVFALARYAPDGSLDPQFGGTGTVTTAFPAPNDALATAVAVQDDGKIVTVGRLDAEAHLTLFGLVRFGRFGRLDSTFGTSGKVATGFGVDAGARGVAVQDDGKIVAAGGYLDGFALARYLAS